MTASEGFIETAREPNTLVVNEIFGPTVQGEGPSMGRACGFIRLGGCNLSCKWCDTPYTWDWTGRSDTGIAFSPREELRVSTHDDIIADVLAMNVDLVVVTGGEPLNQQLRVVPLIKALANAGIKVEIETNGTIPPLDELVSLGPRFNVSPKLAYAGDPSNRRIVPQALRRFNETTGVAFKFVCQSVAHLEEVAKLQEQHGLREIWITPEGKTVDEINRHLSDLADHVVQRRWNLSHRLHMLAWGERRGV